MVYPLPFVARGDREQSIVERARAAARIAAEHAARHDREGTFPEEGLAALAASGYLALTVPEHLGGEGATVPELVLGSLELARGDASLALVVAMHHALIGRVRDAALWPESVFASVAGEIVARRDGRGALINGLATEPEMGSPSRGGLPKTRAERTAGGWRVSGRKSFSSGAPVLQWGVISATIAPADEESNARPRVANFLVPLDQPGVRIEPSWDTLGMRATSSHTVVLENVWAPPEAELPRPQPTGDETPPVPYERAWSLTVAAVYLGVAEAARAYAVQFAQERRPTALSGQSIASVPHIRRRTGEMDLLLYQARGLLLSTARAWEALPDRPLARADMDAALAAAKVTAANAAVSVAEAAMRLAGGSSLSRSTPLERHFRDVRGGLHHPPQDDAALEQLAHEALDGTL